MDKINDIKYNTGMDEKKNNFMYGLAITLGTITIGLISYIFYISNLASLKEPPRCEYNGWAYADKETYESEDGCNTCFCHTGETVCTEIACEDTTTEQIEE